MSIIFHLLLVLLYFPSQYSVSCLDKGNHLACQLLVLSFTRKVFLLF